MKDILKKYDDMRVMRMIKKQLIKDDISLENLRSEYNEKEDELLVLGIRKEITNRPIDEEELNRLSDRLAELKNEIADLEEDKNKLLTYNAYTRG